MEENRSKLELEEFYAERVRCYAAIAQAAAGKDDISCAKALPADLGDCGRIPMIRKSVEILKKKYDTSVAVTTSIVGPFSLANMVFGFERLLMWMITEPELYRRCLEATTQFAVRYCSLLEKMGGDIIQIGEAACSGDLVSVEDYERNIMP